MTDISKKNSAPSLPVLHRVVQPCLHPLSQRSSFAPPPDPAIGKDIARIWFSEKKMSTLAMSAPGRLFAAARRGPRACRDRSRQQGADGGQKLVHRHSSRVRSDGGRSRQRNLRAAQNARSFNTRFRGSGGGATNSPVSYGTGSISPGRHVLSNHDSNGP
jgi:hypothetical protein